MKKRTIRISKNRLTSNNKRRQLLKRVHKKVSSRRQLYQTKEVTESIE
ncbi:MAG: hypothetical protein JKY14_13410 [Paraglaciecola sp.]|nr:hypothetical protein [Paraglaciecola sp.]